MFSNGTNFTPAFDIVRRRLLPFNNQTGRDAKISLKNYIAVFGFFAFLLSSGQIKADDHIAPAEIEGINTGERFSILSDSEAKIFTKTCTSLSGAIAADEAFEIEFHYIFRDTSVCDNNGVHRLCRAFVVKKNSTFCTEIPKLNGTLRGVPYVVVETLVDLTESLRGNSDIANLLASPHRSRVAMAGYSEAGEMLILESRDVIIFAPTGE
ncbi:MAG: hypothetical protein U1A24_11125 [Cypionkella sp.]|uniref:hypothetical protein n=1 Tax=Cypionkella sp. TaxID=2811411 RepID=UPI002ABA3DA0|nr:hypothetical protein [Cypionkella sp.]MDZ4311093.1 hypothetical protein [Cypionkella sp.]